MTLPSGSSQPVAVVGVDVRRGVAAAHRRHRVDVVDVAVGEQHRGRPEPVLGEHVAQGLLDPDARVDDDALLPRAGRQDVAVGAEGGSGEGDGEHGWSVASGACLDWAAVAADDTRRPRVTKEQERARARRRYERQQASLVQRESDHDRRMRLVGDRHHRGPRARRGRRARRHLRRTTPSRSRPDDHRGGLRAAPGRPGHRPPSCPCPTQSTAEGKTYVATVTTNCGDIELTLDGDEGPPGRGVVRRAGQAELLPQRRRATGSP